MLLALLLALTARALPEQLARSVATADCAAVLEALPEPTAPDERLAAGWCLERTGRSAEALEVLALEGDGVLQEYARWIRSEALVDAGRQDEAIAALEGLTLPDPTGIRVRLLRGRALVEAERSLEARDDLRALLSTDVGVEARYWLAIGGEQRGATEAAIATFRRTWAEAAAGPWAELAAEHLEALGHPVPELHSAAGRELVMARVRTLWEHQQNAEALALLQAIRQEDPPDSRHERLQLARAHFMGRDYPGAVAAWREVLGDPDEAQGSATYLFDYALGTSRIGDYPTAALIYRRLIAVHPDTTQADLASFKLGYLEYDRHQLEQAIPLLEAHVATRPGSSHLNEALWFTGRCQWRLGSGRPRCALGTR